MVTRSASEVAFSVEELDPRRHDRACFDCGVEPLNRHLRTLAAQHRAKGIATTFVLVETDCPATILGYYSLSAAALAFERLTDADRKGLPGYPIPAVRIGRLAIARARRGQRLVELLLANAVKRVLLTRTTLRVFALLAEAKDAPAEAFYRKSGFRLCDPQTRQLSLPLGHEWRPAPHPAPCDRSRQPLPERDVDTRGRATPDRDSGWFGSSADCVECASCTTHQGRMEQSQFGVLAKRRAGRDAEPVGVERQFDLLREIEFRGKAEAGDAKCVPILGCDQELAGKQPFGLATRTVGYLDGHLAADRADRDHQRGPGLRARPRYQILRKATPEDVTRARRRQTALVGQKSDSSTVMRPCGTRLRIRARVALATGPSSGS